MPELQLLPVFLVIGSLTEDQNVLWDGKLHMYLQRFNTEQSVMGRQVLDWQKYIHYAARIFANIFHGQQNIINVRK